MILSKMEFEESFFERRARDIKWYTREVGRHTVIYY